MERAREQGRGTLAVTVRDRAPEVDGLLHDWPQTGWADLGGPAKAAVTVAGDRLHVAFRTGDPKILTNGGEDYRYLFKTGGGSTSCSGPTPRPIATGGSPSGATSGCL